MNNMKRIAFAALIIACIAAAALLFLPEQQQPAPETPEVASPVTEEEQPTPEREEAEPVATPAPVATDEKPEGTDWNTYHGDNALRGVTGMAVPDEMERLWQVMTGGPVYVSPVALDGTIFAATEHGGVIAVNRAGEELWRKELTAPAPGRDGPQPVYIDAPITAVHGRVLVGGDLGDVFALCAETGEQLWQANIGGPVRGAPNYDAAGNHVFVIEQDLGELVCLDAATGTEVWRSEGVDRSDGSPAVAADVAVFGSCASSLHIISTADGERLRDILIANGGGQVAGGVALVDGFAYAGVRDGRIMRGNVAEGAFIWITGISDDEVFTTPAVFNDWVIVSSYDGRIHGLDRETGDIRWQHDLGGKPSSPIIAGDKIIVAADGALFLLGLEDGEQRWELRLADNITGPAILQDMLVVGGDDGVLTALGPKK